MRSRPKPWGEQLWDRVSRFLDMVETFEERLDFAEGERLPDLLAEAREIRREMLAEETRRASG